MSASLLLGAAGCHGDGKLVVGAGHVAPLNVVASGGHRHSEAWSLRHQRLCLDLRSRLPSAVNDLATTNF